MSLWFPSLFRFPFLIILELMMWGKIMESQPYAQHKAQPIYVDDPNYKQKLKEKRDKLNNIEKDIYDCADEK